MFTTWLTGYLVPWLVTFTLLGVILQVLDRIIGVPLYRWYFNRASDTEHQMPQAVAMGFFYNQSLRRQHNRALLVSTLQSVVTVLAGKYNFGELILEIFALVLEGWFLLPGLWLGNKVYALMQRQEQIFDAIDHRQEYAEGLMTKIKGGVSGLWSALRPKKSPPPPATVSTHTTAAPPEAPKKSWREQMDVYGKRGKTS